MKGSGGWGDLKFLPRLSVAHSLACAPEVVSHLPYRFWKYLQPLTCGAHYMLCGTANLFICDAQNSAPQVKCYLWRTSFVVRHRYSLT